MVTTDGFWPRDYSRVFEGNDRWNQLQVGAGDLYEWDENSTYIQEPPFLIDLPPTPAPIAPIRGARVLALLGDSITTDHISPAGGIAKDGAAGRYLQECGIEPRDFNSYGSRRGNDRVMTRGTFANVRIRNRLAPGTEGGLTRHLPDGEVMTIFDASVKYRNDGIPLIILAGAEYGSGSSRDWAAKGTTLLGVKAVIAAGYERIHRSNLVGMGVLPLQFQTGETWKSLGLTGEEVYDIDCLGDDLAPGEQLTVRATAADGTHRQFTVIARIESPIEVDYYRQGGILPAMLRQMLEAS